MGAPHPNVGPISSAPSTGGIQPKQWAVIGVVAAVVILVAVLSVMLLGEDTPETVAAQDSSTAAEYNASSTVEPEIDYTPSPPIVTARPASEVALRVSAPISQPPCDGTGIVVLGSAVVPGKYESEIQRLLNANPGANYLRTDHACPSLRQVSDAGTPIYAVYRIGGRTQFEVCSAVRAAGGDAYGKWLDMTTDPKFMLPC
jgi:serine/threonine-protein kinase